MRKLFRNHYLKVILKPFLILLFFLIASTASQNSGKQNSLLSAFFSPGKAFAYDLLISQCKNTLLGANVTLTPIGGVDPSKNYIWFGPFGSAASASAQVYMPEGRHTVTYYVDNGTAFIDKQSFDVMISSGFDYVTAEIGSNTVKLIWPTNSNATRYEVYRGSAMIPSYLSPDIPQFTKIAEVGPGKKNTAKYTDRTAANGDYYAYIIGELLNGSWKYSSAVGATPRKRGEFDHARLCHPHQTTATTGTPYSYDIILTRGTSSISTTNSTIVNGVNLISYPEGMTIDQDNRIQWMPEAPGSYPVVIQHYLGDGEWRADNFTINVGSYPAPVTVSLSANPLSVNTGGTTHLTWNSTYADKVSIDQGIGVVSTSGETDAIIQNETTFTISGSVLGTTVTDSVTVKVGPSVSIQADPRSMPEGETSYLTWTSTNADTVSIDQGIGDVDLNSTGPGLPVSPTQTTTYTITATKSGTTATDTVQVEVYPQLQLQVDSPADGLHTTNSSVNVSGQVSDGAGVTINDNPVIVTDSHFSKDYPLTIPGSYPFTIVASDSHGQQLTKVRTVTYAHPQLSLQIDSPANDANLYTPDVTVTGHVSNNAAVTVNGIAATVTGDLFSADIVLSNTGSNTITAVATDGFGQEETQIITVTYSPELTLEITTPVPNTIIYKSSVQVTGQVSNDATVLVNGIEATVNGSSYTAEIQLLTQGTHTIVVNATDGFGQQISASVDILYFDLPVVAISADKYRISSGESVLLSWTAQNCESVILEPGAQSVNFSDTLVVTPTETTRYTIYAARAETFAKESLLIVVDDAYGDPSPAEQVHLEAINKARSNPLAEAARLGIDLNEGPPDEYISPDPLPPLKFNEQLNRAAQNHTLDMTTNKFFAHEGSDGSTPADRADAEGYAGNIAENIATRTANFPLDEIETSKQLHDDLFLDINYPGRGHRINILDSRWKDAGIGLIMENVTAGYPYGGTVTCDFGAPADNGTAVLGIVYEDKNSDQQYNAGEGIADVMITDADNANMVYTATAGGYALVLPSGLHSVMAVLPDGRTLTKQVDLGQDNVKLDFELSMFIDLSPQATLWGEKYAIQQGETVDLTWESANAEYAEIDNGIGYVPVNGTIRVSPVETTTYTITVHQQARTATASFTVYVCDFTSPPTLEFTTSSQTINKGESTYLIWAALNADHVFIDNGLGNVSPDGTAEVTPDHTTTYTITATNPGGITTEKIRIQINANPALQPPGSFGELYNDKMPPDATIPEYDPELFALANGRVTDDSNQGLAGVNVTVLGHPMYGTAFTGTDGTYTMPVMGGKTFTLVFTADGYLSAQRQVHVPANDFGTTETVALIQQDISSTEVLLNGDPGTVITHKSSVVSDEDGQRSVSVVFQGSNRAFIVDENGNDIQELTQFIARATEYRTPESMPAKLPPTSAFTFCAELSVDGAQRVRFENPVVTWVDNFLGFETGTVVPSGFYDRDKGIWVASKNGIVVQLLDTNDDGNVDALDSNGDAVPDDLNENGDIHDEVMGLTDGQAYLPGSNYWRVEVTHFTPWDYNWATSLQLANLFDYTQPSLDDQPCLDCRYESKTGSSVGDDSQIFYESIPIPGTELSLAYASDRTEGYKNIITVPVSGLSVPNDIIRITVEIDIAGQVLTRDLPPDPCQVAEFEWDGLDAFQNQVYHQVTAHVKIGYVYDSVYLESPYLDNSFAEFGTVATSVPARDEVINWRRSDLTINIADKDFDLASGWSISAHHKLDPTDPSTLHFGNGYVAKNVTTVMAEVAGNGQQGWPQDGAKALETPLTYPSSTAMDAQGNLYVANQVYPAILKIDKTDNVEVIAGGEYAGSFEDNIDAKTARLERPNDIAFDTNGNLYIADAGLYQIKKINKNGIITTVAGSGEPCYYGDFNSCGDGGPALEANMVPTSVAVDTHGNIYFSEGMACVGGQIDPVSGECIDGLVVESSYRVRKVSTNGIINTIAGIGIQYDPIVHPNNGDGGPASAAVLYNPTGISIDPDGNIYIADGPRIRKIDTSGTISTVAGTGITGYTGDGGLATDAQITNASGISFDDDGSFYFSQYFGNGDVIRKVTSDGYITTVAGKGIPGLSGDNGPATHAQLKQPQRLTLGSNGIIYFADQGNHLVRMIKTGTYKNQEIHFTEADGTGHLISADGYHLSTYDLNTRKDLLTFGYNSHKKLVSITDQFGNIVRIERPDGIKATEIISPDGLRTQLVLDEHNQLTQLIYPETAPFIFEYDHNDGLLTAKNEPNGNRFEHVFDTNGRVLSTNDLEGGSWQFNKEKFHDGLTRATTTTPNTFKQVIKQILSTGDSRTDFISPAGADTTTVTSADGLLQTTESPCGSVRTSQYDLDRMFGYTYLKDSCLSTPGGLLLDTRVDKIYTDDNQDGAPETVTRTVTVNGKPSTLVHDVAAASYTTTSPENRTTTSYYDPLTLLVTKTSLPGLYDTDYTYKIDGRIETVTVGSRQSSYTYYPDGNLETVTDPMNRVTTFLDYDAVGRAKTVQRPDNSLLQYAYDENGNMTLYRTARPADNTFVYTHTNKRQTFQAPLGGTTGYAYNAERQLTHITLPSTKQIVNYYLDSRLENTVTPEWTNVYTYTCGDLVDTITRTGEVIDYDYDSSLVTSITQTGTLNKAVEMTYNNDFNVVSLAYAGGTEILDYDNDGLLIRSGNYTIIPRFDNGLPETVTDNTLTLTRGFNGYGEVDSLDHDISGSRYAYSVTRYNDGKIHTRTETVNGTAIGYVYTYDDFGRLHTVTKDGGLTEEYRYDDNGNRNYLTNTYHGLSGMVPTQSIEDHVITAGSATYEFDTDDRLSRVTSGEDITEYTYSSTGELMCVILPDTRVIEYVHDPLGRRIAKKINGTTVKKYLWSGQTTLLAVFDGNDTLLQRFEYADGRMPVSMMAAGVRYYLACDQVGTLRLVSDAAGNPVKQIDYDSFGKIVNDTNPSFDVPFGFAGGLHDKDTGLVRFGFRDYLPAIGKWTAKDPIDFAAGDSNLFGYCLNDPVNWIDPDGLTGIEATIGGAGAYTAGGGSLAGAAGAAAWVAGPAAAGALGYFGTQALLDGTWLGEGGLGDWLYDQLHDDEGNKACPAYQAEHRKNKRKSNKNKHQKGQKRKNQKYKDKKRQNPNWIQR